jgi:hypothetical protein
VTVDEVGEHGVKVPASRLLRLATVRAELHPRGEAGIAGRTRAGKQRRATLRAETRPRVGYGAALGARGAAGGHPAIGLPRIRRVPVPPAMMAARSIAVMTTVMAAGHPP